MRQCVYIGVADPTFGVLRDGRGGDAPSAKNEDHWRSCTIKQCVYARVRDGRIRMLPHARNEYCPAMGEKPY